MREGSGKRISLIGSMVGSMTHTAAEQNAKPNKHSVMVNEVAIA